MQLLFKNKYRFLLFVLWFGYLNTAAIFAQEKENYQVTSPYHTIFAFLDNLQSDNFNPSLAARTLNAYNLSQERKEALAIKLKQILDGRGLYVRMENLPRNPDYQDTLTQKSKYVLFAAIPEIYVEKIGNVWLFSTETVEAIPRLHQEIYPFGLDYLLELMPKNANQKFLGLNLWQYLGLLVLVIFTFLLHRLLSFLIGRVILRFITRIRKEIALKLVQPIARPLSLFILCWILVRMVPVLVLPPSLNWAMLMVLNLAIPVYVIMILMNIVDFISIFIERHAAHTASTLDDQLAPLIRKTLKIVLVVLGVIYILQNLQFNVTALIAGLSIGTLAFALAAQDTIKNLFGSVTIFLDRPFQVGDWIVSGDVNGSVEEVGFRSTRIRTFHNSLIYIPNGRLADMTIDNMGLRVYRRYRTNLSITYDTPPELVEAFVEGLKEIVKNHHDTRKDMYHIYLNEFSAASIDVLFYIFFKVPDWGDELRARQEVMLAILHLAKALGVRFAFPTQTLHIEEMPGKESLTPNYSAEYLNKNQLNEKVSLFVAQHFQGEKG